MDSRYDDLVGVIVREQAAHQGFGVGVLLDTAFLKLVEFLARLPVEVLAVDHEQAFVDVRVVLEQRGGLERGERFATAGGVPDVAVATALVDAVHDGLHGINLVWPHHQQLLFARHQHHVAADHLAQRAFGEEALGKGIEVGDLLVVLGGELIDGQEAFVGVEAEMAGVVVGEVPGVGSVANDKELEGDGAKNVGLVIFSDTFHQNVLKPDGSSDVVYDVTSQQKNFAYLTDYDFYARYQNTGAITAGRITSNVLVNVIYE